MFFSIFAEPRSDGPPRGAGDVQQPSAEAAGQAEERQKRPAQGPLIGFAPPCPLVGVLFVRKFPQRV